MSPESVLESLSRYSVEGLVFVHHLLKEGVWWEGVHCFPHIPVHRESIHCYCSGMLEWAHECVHLDVEECREQIVRGIPPELGHYRTYLPMWDMRAN